MIRKFIAGFRTVILAMALVIGVLAGIQWLNQHQQDQAEKRDTYVHQIIGKPYVHKGNPAKPNNVARPGDLVFVHNKYVKSERCHVQVANFLINAENDYVLHHSQFLNWFPAGKFTANEMIKLPNWLPKGKYRLLKKSTSFCGDQVYYFINFDVLLTVK